MLSKQMYLGKAIVKIFGFITLYIAVSSSALSQQADSPAYPPDMPGAQIEIYKTAGDFKLRLWIFNPEEHSANDHSAAIIFFFGGGWYAGSPDRCSKHCEYLAARGMVAIAADYRVISRNGVTPVECVSDAKSAVRWVRANANRLGIDPNRIAAGGGSSGGHLAAATATLSLYDDPGDDLSIRAIPNAMVLFCPSVVLASVPDKFVIPDEQIANEKKRLGLDPSFDPKSFSPYHNLISGVGPTIIFHGTNDIAVPYLCVELYREKMRSLGNRCELVGYKGAGHGFFNYGQGNNAAFIDTVNKMDAFFVSLGYLNGPPETIQYK